MTLIQHRGEPWRTVEVLRDCDFCGGTTLGPAIRLAASMNVRRGGCTELSTRPVWPAARVASS